MFGLILCLDAFQSVETHYMPNYQGWRRAFEQQRQLAP